MQEEGQFFVQRCELFVVLAETADDFVAHLALGDEFLVMH